MAWFGSKEDKGEKKPTAYCKDVLTYTSGTPILSITFSLAKEHPFEVWVNPTSKTDSKQIYPILYEIRDLTAPEEPIVIKPLKNKSCIAKNLPDDLEKHLLKLNSLLLNEYRVYYDKDKLDKIKAAQDEFANPSESNKDNGEEAEAEEEEEEEAGEVEVEVADEDNGATIEGKLVGVASYKDKGGSKKKTLSKTPPKKNTTKRRK